MKSRRRQDRGGAQSDKNQFGSISYNAATRDLRNDRNSSEDSLDGARLVSPLSSDSRARKKLTYSKREARPTAETSPRRNQARCSRSQRFNSGYWILESFQKNSSLFLKRHQGLKID